MRAFTSGRQPEGVRSLEKDPDGGEKDPERSEKDPDWLVILGPGLCDGVLLMVSLCATDRCSGPVWHFDFIRETPHKGFADYSWHNHPIVFTENNLNTCCHSISIRSALY